LGARRAQFDYSLDFASIDFRRHPQLYRVGRGEQGVLLVEPYKSEILPHWRFRTPRIARASANRIYRLFLAYKAQEDFVGMDMARKFLQMGYTRSRRYANYKGGRKYRPGTRQVAERQLDEAKADSARVFYEKWRKAREDKRYLALKAKHEATSREPARRSRERRRRASPP
jgi:hypothetical protein